MVTNNLFSTKQYGFINGRSTVLQLLNVMDTWTSAIDKGDCVDTVYLDFMKAFDGYRPFCLTVYSRSG